MITTSSEHAAQHLVFEANRLRLLLLVGLMISGLVPGVKPASVQAADAVIVTAVLDKASIRVGESAKLIVSGRVSPDIVSASDRIFSWYVDGLNSAAGTAAPQWDQLLMPASDSPTGAASLSSRGTIQGADRIGIRNTFLTKPGAGISTAVELFEVNVTGMAAGQVVFSVRAGTGTPNVAYDFQVARQGGGAAFTGGDYSSASVILTVIDDADDDHDGLTNVEEAALGSNPALPDTDHDGLTDLEEYAYGSSLVLPFSAFRPVAARAMLNVGGVTSAYQEVIVRRNSGAQRIAVRVESSADISAWQPNAVLVSTQNNGDGTQTETYRSPQPLQSVSRSFLRVIVVRM